LKPRTFTSSLGTSVGLCWEIARGTNLTSDGRTIDFYTKSGNLGEYHSLIILVPDYDLVAAINMAGPQGSFAAVEAVFSGLVQAMLPAIDQAGKTQASKAYTGTFAAGSNSSMTLAVDEYGLVVKNFIANGVDVPAGYAAYTGGVVPAATIRLYPTNLSSGNKTAWRAVYQADTLADLKTFEENVFFPGASCQSWSTEDSPLYGLQAIDLFVFTQDAHGILVEVEAKAWNLVLRKMAMGGKSS
jgi:hypothetical protein